MSIQSTLLVDIGNTAIKWCFCLQDEVIAGDLKGELKVSQKIYPTKISSDFFIELWQQFNTPTNIIVSCVGNDSVLNALQQAGQKLWSRDVTQMISTQKSYHFLNAYEEPAQLGDDRFCGMVAAYHHTDADYMVVDCGSAITIDIVSKDSSNVRAHQGGYIFPGLGLMKASLGQKTANVEVNNTVSPADLLPGNTTEECVNAAIYLSAITLIERIFRQQEKEGMQCILTGGDAEELAKFLSIKYSLVPDLVLRGLWYLCHTKKITS